MMMPSQPQATPSELRCFAEIVGDSAPLRDVLQQVRAVAPTRSTVLIQGETGTGKERIAHALHAASAHARGPFVKLNCAAIPAGLIESELMGHERGAFTGASARRIGRFEAARDGTLFLDEIGELPLALQPKLLRLLEEREFERVGGERTLHSNARLIAATNRDLAAMVAQGAFREDLYYRLSVFPLLLPPLRERREDLAPLVQHFVQRFAAQMGKDVRGVSATALARLVAHDWPGNVRELANVIERAVILCEQPVLELPALALRSLPVASTRSKSEHMAEVSRHHILTVLEATNWVVAGPEGAAARLGMKRSTLNFRMKKLGIVRDGAGLTLVRG
jgi:transcriptional regulator with GAF, ATPase, and Fis domain